MNTFAFTAVVLAAFGVSTSASATDEGKADLDSYSVGDRRPRLEIDEMKIERPKFENNFKLDMPKPGLGALKMSKPQFEVLPEADAAKGDEQGTGPIASADTSRPSPVPPNGGETRSVRALKMDPPDYPREALIKREQGFVVVEFTITPNGDTEDIRVIEAEPRNTFDREAQRAVGRWKFEPALRDGRPVAQRIRHTIEFKLTD